METEEGVLSSVLGRVWKPWPESFAWSSAGQPELSLPRHHILLARARFQPIGSTAGGLWGTNLISGGVYYGPRPLASQPVAKRKVHVLFCCFTFLLSASTMSSSKRQLAEQTCKPLCRAEMKTTRGETPDLAFSGG